MATKILVVDDDLNICELLKIFLENEDYQVKTASDGAEGVNYLRSRSCTARYHAAEKGRLAGMPRDKRDIKQTYHHDHRKRRDLR